MKDYFGDLPAIEMHELFGNKDERVSMDEPRSSITMHDGMLQKTSCEDIENLIENARHLHERLEQLKIVATATEKCRQIMAAAWTAPVILTPQVSKRPWSYAPNQLLAPSAIKGGEVDVADVAERIVYIEDPRLPRGLSYPGSTPRRTIWQRLYKFFIANVFEKRGIERVEPHERHDLSSFGFKQMTVLWFSMNLAANNITLGMLGPLVFQLGFLDSCLCAMFGMLLGSIPAAWVAVSGPRSGLRTMVWSRYTMGWNPAKLVVLLNIVELLGYCMIDAVIAGQMLSAVSPKESLNIVAGIMITAAITLLITTFGYSVFHYYERYARWPQMFALCLLAGAAGPGFNVSSQPVGTTATVIGNRISFFSLCLSAAITYSGCAGSFFVYYPNTLPPWKVFSTAMTGLTLSFAFTLVLGIGLACGARIDPLWRAAESVSLGALIVEALRPLGAFGSLCSVIIALGLISNVVPTAYASAIDFQMLGRYWARIPRVAWNAAGIAVFTICAAAGRDELAGIFTNFLALMGYWCSIWIALVIEEQYLFRKRGYYGPMLEIEELAGRIEGIDHGFDWTKWNTRDCLPKGWAAMAAFLLGWLGAILCMAQEWYIGPFARLIGHHGADMGNYVGFVISALVFPPLRHLEFRRYGR